MALGVTKRERVRRRADRWWRSVYHSQLIYERDPKSIDNSNQLSERNSSSPLNETLLSDDPTLHQET
jgi:hypothetical protein